MTASVERATTAALPARLEIVVGIDPGTRVLGYGAIVIGARGPRLLAAGVVRARQSEVTARLGQIRADLDDLFRRLGPTVIVVEQAFAARNVQSALRIGEGRGVVLGCAAATGARIVQYAPAVAKKALVGHGAADKSQVARMVEQLLGPKAKGLPLDASDALGLALAFCARARMPGEPALPRASDSLPVRSQTGSRQCPPETVVRVRPASQAVPGPAATSMGRAGRVRGRAPQRSARSSP